MAIAFAGVARHVVVGHVLHDFRPETVAAADRDAVKRLADRLGMTFAAAEVRVRAGAGNAEARAREARYRELARLAVEYRCRYIAVAHQGDDLLETVLMRLLRGAGPAGLGAMRPVRALAGGATLLRPMLGITRADCERVCHAAGWVWQEDETNLDTSRLRAALRARVLPVLRELSPSVAARVRASAELSHEAAMIVAERAGAMLERSTRSEGRIAIERSVLAAERAVVVGEYLRRVARGLCRGLGADAWGSRAVGSAVACIRSEGHGRKTFALRGVEVVVTGRRVEVRLLEPAQAG